MKTKLKTEGKCNEPGCKLVDQVHINIGGSISRLCFMHAADLRDALDRALSGPEPDVKWEGAK